MHSTNTKNRSLLRRNRRQPPIAIAALSTMIKIAHSSTPAMRYLLAKNDHRKALLPNRSSSNTPQARSMLTTDQPQTLSPAHMRPQSTTQAAPTAARLQQPANQIKAEMADKALHASHCQQARGDLQLANSTLGCAGCSHQQKFARPPTPATNDSQGCPGDSRLQQRHSQETEILAIIEAMRIRYRGQSASRLLCFLFAAKMVIWNLDSCTKDYLMTSHAPTVFSANI